MDILIIEDEALAADKLEKMLKDIKQDANIVAKISSVKDSIKWLMNNKVDLIFIDIQLSDGVSFKIFDQLDIKTPLIFTTAYDKYAVRAFKLNSISYLLKPIRQQDLIESLDKYEKLKSAFSIDFEKLIAAYTGKKKETPKKRFLISVGEILKKIESDDIAYFYAMEKNVFCKTFDNKTHPVDYSLDKLETLLDPETFFRINRKYIVNIEAIKTMVSWSRSRIKLELIPEIYKNEDAVVSISRSSDFKEWMNR